MANFTVKFIGVGSYVHATYGPNDNVVRGVGNNEKPGLVVNELFNRRGRKRSGHRHRKKLDPSDLTFKPENC